MDLEYKTCFVPTMVIWPLAFGQHGKRSCGACAGDGTEGVDRQVWFLRMAESALLAAYRLTRRRCVQPGYLAAGMKSSKLAKSHNGQMSATMGISWELKEVGDLKFGSQEHNSRGRNIVLASGSHSSESMDHEAEDKLFRLENDM